MCYNCGCGVIDDNMGRPTVSGASLTEESIEEMATKWGMTIEETKENIYRELKKQLKKD